jgi:hypothetical protein
MELDAAQAALDAAQTTFEDATHALLQACIHQQALDLALKRGLRPGDAICHQIDKVLASASMRVWEARQARDAAAADLQAAETPSKPETFPERLAWVRAHDPILSARYDRDLAKREQAQSADEISHADWNLARTRRAIRDYRPPMEVA